MSVMKIALNDTRTVREIQNEFSHKFPYLKIEFFDVPYVPKAPTPKAKMYNAERKLGFCRKIHAEGIMELGPQKTVAEVEKELWEKYGLTAQIFRKLGSVWVETNLTDAWTLERQNNEGRELRFDQTDTTEDNDLNDRDVWR